MSIKADTIFITGLDTAIGEDEIRSEIFRPPQFTVLSVTLNYTRDGKSAGTANVRFATPAQAAAAQKEYNGALVDGKAMSVQLIGVPTQPHVIVKVPQPKVEPKAVAPAPRQQQAPAPRQPQQQQQQQYQRQQQPPHYNQPLRQQQQQQPLRRTQQQQYNAPAPRGAARPVVAARQPQFTSARPAAAPRKQQQQAPVAKKAAPVAKKAAPVAKKAVAKKVAPKAAPKKVLTPAELDAQLDKYNQQREAAQ